MRHVQNRIGVHEVGEVFEYIGSAGIAEAAPDTVCDEGEQNRRLFDQRDRAAQRGKYESVAREPGRDTRASSGRPVSAIAASNALAMESCKCAFDKINIDRGIEGRIKQPDTVLIKKELQFAARVPGFQQRQPGLLREGRGLVFACRAGADDTGR